MAKTIFEGMSFDDLCKRYLKEGAEIADLSTDAPVEGGVDETGFDAEMDAPADEFGGEEGLEGEGDVTITLTADLVSALRTILALVDGEGDMAADDELGAEDDVMAADDEMGLEDEGVDAEFEGDVEEFEEEEQQEDVEVDVTVEEQEETLLGNGQGASHAPVSSPSSAPNRKKETPAVNRKGTGEGDFSKVTSRMGEPATVSSATSAPDRKKGTPAVDRKPTNTVHKAKPGKKVLDINR
jgi:hypothetical protein